MIYHHSQLFCYAIFYVIILFSGIRRQKKESSGLKTSILQKRNLLREVNVRKKWQLTPKAAKLYSIAIEYKSVRKNLNYEVESNRQRIKQAIQTAESETVFKNRVNSTTFKFLQSQIKQQIKKPKGRREVRFSR